MNALLWILQIALALLYFAGGAYKLFMFDQLANQMLALPRSVWGTLGIVEMVCAILIVIPASPRWIKSQIPLAATVLALETLILAALYARYSLELTVANPMVWAIVMGLLVAFLAYGRYALRPATAA